MPIAIGHYLTTIFYCLEINWLSARQKKDPLDGERLAVIEIVGGSYSKHSASLALVIAAIGGRGFGSDHHLCD
jgi:hypothetical protein